MGDLFVDYMRDIGSIENTVVFGEIMKNYNMSGAETCVTPAKTFEISSCFVSSDQNWKFVFRPDITSKKKETQLVPTDYVLYFDAKCKTRALDPDIMQTYTAGREIVLRRPSNVRGKLRRVEAVIDIVLSRGERLCVANAKERVTATRPAKTFAVLGLRFNHKDTLQFEEDEKEKKRQRNDDDGDDDDDENLTEKRSKLIS